MQTRMKAVRLHSRGGPEKLVFEDAPMPALRGAEVLVRVHAAGITPTELSWDETYQNADGSARIPSIPGHEFAGTIETGGSSGRDLWPGEAVFGMVGFTHDGSAAEFVAVDPGFLAPKPRTLDYAVAAGVPLSALTAWQALFVHGEVSRGRRVLIHGAAGGVGSFAVQLAHWRGAYVIATSAARNVSLLRQLGADEVIDYTADRFENRARGIDMVLDTVGGETRQRSWSVLGQGGVLVTLPGPVPPQEAAQHAAHGVFFIVEPSRPQLMEIGRLIDEGRVRPLVEAVLPIEHAREAFERGLSGHNRGKIVLEVSERRAFAR